MKSAVSLAVLAFAAVSAAQDDLPPGVRVERDIPYVEPKNPRQILDVFAPANARKAPVVVWVHGGGWQVGDKTQVARKPAAFTAKGYVFVPVNYRFVPHVKMGDIIRDVTRSVKWTHANIARYGGDPGQIFLMGHSAGAQLAAIVSTDPSWLRAEGLPLSTIKGCVPVDGDTYDVPLQVVTAQARRKSLGQPDPKMGHPEKFGPPELQRAYSAVRHIAKGKGIPPFLIMHVADHTDTTAQAHRLWSELREAGIDARVYGGEKTDHVKLDRDIGVEGDPGTVALFSFADALRK